VELNVTLCPVPSQSRTLTMSCDISGWSSHLPSVCNWSVYGVDLDSKSVKVSKTSRKELERKRNVGLLGFHIYFDILWKLDSRLSAAQLNVKTCHEMWAD
jgi:hypothetical protein